MTDPGPVLFKTSLRANPWRLLAIWVFLIVLPVILLFAATDSILTEGEQQLEEKIKLQLHQELVDFRDSLSFSSFLETRLSECTGPLLANPEVNAGQLANLLHSSLTFQPAAIFSYHVASDQFSMSVHEAVKGDLGLISRTMMKNLLTRQVGSAARVTNNAASASSHRSRGYLRSLLSSPGILQLKAGRALGAFSGKPSLGRLLIYYLQTPGQPEAGSGHILIFRERDIPVRKLVEKACGEVSNHGFTRQFTSSDEGWRAIYRLSNDRMQFHGSRQHGYSLTALPTADLLLRLATGGTLYPARLPELIARLPILSVTAPAAIMQHPLRGVITSTRLPALLMVLVASMVILRLYFFGFGSSLRIGPRLFISVLAASLLPFSTLIVAAAWHEQFIKDFAISEMTQHIQLQADQINRTITASLNARERELADLTKFLGSLDFNAAASFLKRWLPAHSATMAIYNENEREIIVVIDKNEKLNEFETDMK
ncbi:MAG TPA: hypothetical protein PLM07_21570, partial [Candidatus Rifleibacterium sp.]|nr:hypothetical protein [Candidatus Rifleibacterium sp.]